MPRFEPPAPEEIKDARKRSGLSQKELANEIGYSLSQVARWEQGKSKLDKPVVWERIKQLAYEGEVRRAEEQRRREEDQMKGQR